MLEMLLYQKERKLHNSCCFIIWPKEKFCPKLKIPKCNYCDFCNGCNKYELWGVWSLINSLLQFFFAIHYCKYQIKYPTMNQPSSLILRTVQRVGMASLLSFSCGPLSVFFCHWAHCLWTDLFWVLDVNETKGKIYFSSCQVYFEHL